MFAFVWNGGSAGVTNYFEIPGLAATGLDPSKAVFFRLGLNAQSNGVWNTGWAGPASIGVAGVTSAGTERWAITMSTNEILFVALNNNASYLPGSFVRSTKLRRVL